MRSQKLGPLFTCLLLVGAAFAQEFRGRVQGVVTDVTGASVPAAPITLKNIGTGVESTRMSNDQGRYVFDYVDPGTYTLAAEAKGFKKSIRSNVLVQQRGDVTVDFKLELGTLSESITVDASPVAL